MLCDCTLRPRSLVIRRSILLPNVHLDEPLRIVIYYENALSDYVAGLVSEPTVLARHTSKVLYTQT